MIQTKKWVIYFLPLCSYDGIKTSYMEVIFMFVTSTGIVNGII